MLLVLVTAPSAEGYPLANFGFQGREDVVHPFDPQPTQVSTSSTIHNLEKGYTYSMALHKE